ncbi:MAG: hypothetical protein ACI8RD_008552 [Bacillariaceae sp.]|jgi:hypothetical protein
MYVCVAKLCFTKSIVALLILYYIYCSTVAFYIYYYYWFVVVALKEYALIANLHFPD